MAKSRTARRGRPQQGPRTVAPRPLAARTRHILWLLLAAALLLSVAANLAIDPKGHFGIDGSFGFFAWFGFAACVALVVIGKIFGVFLRRDETYYADGPDAGTEPPGGPTPGAPRPGTAGGKSAS